MSENSVISGVLHGFPQARLILRSADLSDQIITDESGAFQFSALPAGLYRLSAPEIGLVQTGLELDGSNHVRVDLGEFEQQTLPEQQEQVGPQSSSQVGWAIDISEVGRSPGFGIIRVIVEGVLDLPVQISAANWSGFARHTGSKTEYGPYALEFAPLGAGIYTVAPAGLGVTAEIDINADQVLLVSFTPSETDDDEPEPGQPAESVIRGQVRNGAGLTIYIQGPAGEQSTVIGGDEIYQFKQLPPGIYSAYIPNTEALHGDLEMDGSNQRTVDFSLPDEGNPSRSSILGTVSNGAGLSIVLSGPEGEQIQTIGQDEGYWFENLPAGVYSLRVLNTDARRSGLEMDGLNQRRANFKLVTDAQTDSIIFGSVPGGAGLEVLLQGPGGLDMLETLDELEKFGFTDLPAGSYIITVFGPQGDVSETVELDGANQAEVILELPHTPSTGRGYTIEDGGVGPGYGVVRVRIEGGAGLGVHLWAHGWQGMVRHIGERAELGEFICEFAPLGGGSYLVEPQGAGVRAEVQIDGSRIMWVIFEPSGPTDPSDPNEPPIEKTMDICLWVGALPADLTTFLAVLNYCSRFQPAIVSSLAEALQARTAILLGSILTIPEADEAKLVDSGSQVVRIHPERAAAAFQQYVDNDSPF
ncbi:MAG: hypothetical protein GY759_19825 [Chloroflexi bacterium]|nr:hypothetical protein [Chloroflexota bacterium]